MTRCLTWFLMITLLFLPECLADDETPPLTREEIDFFESKIRPILVDRCLDCHSTDVDAREAELSLASREALLKGGDSGPAAKPGDPDGSLLIEVISREDRMEAMPPDGRLDDSVIADFRRWIAMGAPDPRPAGSPQTNGTAGSARQDRGNDHWAFQQPVRPKVPADLDPGWSRTDLDRLAIARMRRQGISPSRPADRDVLIRRVYMDLVGLPPTFEQKQRFREGRSEDAYEKIVDELLDSPHFGERWARHWMDVARYSDTKGYVFKEDRNYPDAYTYRDWVIAAFNDDMPYDRFIICQLAADQLPEDERLEALPAMGYLTLGRRYINKKHEIINDRIDVVCRGMLALTVGCARCHDHKFDPIPIEDYYSLYGVFANSREPKDAPSPLRMVDVEQPHDTPVFLRGNPRNRGEVVPRQFLKVLSGEQQTPFTKGSGRLELAEAIASKDNVLTARVLVNRVWWHLFGIGLVTTPSDFGTRSRPPEQAEVLDYLAIRFVEQGWSMKQLIRDVVLSAIYRQASNVRQDMQDIDPGNRSFWKMNRKRLDFEALRDSILFVSGQLDLAVGGPSVDIVSSPTSPRRTLYGFIDRQNLPSLFRTFDFASPDTHSPRRYETTVPQQGLFLLNSPFIMQQADHLIADLGLEEGRFGPDGVERLFKRVLGREPTDDETRAGLVFLSSGTSDEPLFGSSWQYGFGSFDPVSGVDFHPLPHATKTAWQGAEKLPDAKLGWVTLSAAGGHPGNDHQHAAIRRWIAPRAGRLHLRMLLEHTTDQGDGVRLRLVSSKQGLIFEANARNDVHQETIDGLTVETGEMLDFVIDCREQPSFDSFRSRFEIVASEEASSEEASSEGAPTERWQSVDDFRLTVSEPLAGWQRYAQVLMLTNEFIFVD